MGAVVLTDNNFFEFTKSSKLNNQRSIILVSFTIRILGLRRGDSTKFRANYPGIAPTTRWRQFLRLTPRKSPAAHNYPATAKLGRRPANLDLEQSQRYLHQSVWHQV